jgi:hypothetical protein
MASSSAECKMPKSVCARADHTGAKQRSKLIKNKGRMFCFFMLQEGLEEVEVV